jgi:hypothetical protein
MVHILRTMGNSYGAMELPMEALSGPMESQGLFKHHSSCPMALWGRTVAALSLTLRNTNRQQQLNTTSNKNHHNKT